MGWMDGCLRLVVKGLEPLLVNPGVRSRVQTMSTVSFAVFLALQSALDSVVGRICRNAGGRPRSTTEGRPTMDGATHPSSAGVDASAVGP